MRQALPATARGAQRAAAAVACCLLALLATPSVRAAISPDGSDSIFTFEGPTFVLTTPSWTLLSPIVATKDSSATGVLFYKDGVYTFPAPKNKVGLRPGVPMHTLSGRQPQGTLPRPKRALSAEAAAMNGPQLGLQRLALPAALEASARQRRQVCELDALPPVFLSSSYATPACTRPSAPPDHIPLCPAPAVCLSPPLVRTPLQLPAGAPAANTFPFIFRLKNGLYFRLKLTPVQLTPKGIVAARKAANNGTDASSQMRLSLAVKLPKAGVNATQAPAATRPPLMGSAPYALLFDKASTVASQSSGLGFLSLPKIVTGLSSTKLGKPTEYDYHITAGGKVSVGECGRRAWAGGLRENSGAGVWAAVLALAATGGRRACTGWLLHMQVVASPAPHHALPTHAADLLLHTVCVDGFGGTFGDPPTVATSSGCAICPAGSFASGNTLTQPCRSCKSQGPRSFSSTPGSAKCSSCTGQDAVADPKATSCGESSLEGWGPARRGACVSSGTAAWPQPTSESAEWCDCCACGSLTPSIIVLCLQAAFLSRWWPPFLWTPPTAWSPSSRAPRKHLPASCQLQLAGPRLTSASPAQSW
jgi:hypothetical protein